MKFFSTDSLLLSIIFMFLFFVPLIVAIIYLISGVRVYLKGRREEKKVVTIVGYNRIFYSLLAIGFIFFPWRWICTAFFL